VVFCALAWQSKPLGSPGFVNSITMDPRVEPMPWAAVGVEDGPALCNGDAIGGGLALAAADEDTGAGAEETCMDGAALGGGACASEKVQAESKKMMLVPPRKVAPILKFPRVPMGPVCQAKSGLDSCWLAGSSLPVLRIPVGVVHLSGMGP
jgi:hypothetical protein